MGDAPYGAPPIPFSIDCQFGYLLGTEIFPSLDILPVVVQADAPGGGEEADAGGH
jgi:hypothetical protein